MKQRQITCENCGCHWMRPVQTGRIPKLCADCHQTATRKRNRSQAAPRACDQCGATMTTREKRRRGSRRNYCFECAPLGYHPKKTLGRTCARDGCDENLDGKSATARYCSTECGEYDRGQRVVATTRECPVCRTAFEASGHKRFCQRRCGKAYMNAEKRGTLDKLLAEPWTPPAPFDCAECGKRCTPGENVAQHATKFCGPECKSVWHRVNTEGRMHPDTVTALRVEKRFERAKGKLLQPPTRKQHAEYRRVVRRDPCGLCGGPGEALDHIVPKSAGGDDGMENRSSICRRCNSAKGTLPLLVALTWVPVSRAYHEQRRILFGR